jgi:hypothetical protein
MTKKMVEQYSHTYKRKLTANLQYTFDGILYDWVFLQKLGGSLSQPDGDNRPLGNRGRRGWRIGREQQ